MFKKALVFFHDLAASCAAWFLVVFVRFNFCFCVVFIGFLTFLVLGESSL